jgi:hypothetical protein
MQDNLQLVPYSLADRPVIAGALQNTTAHALDGWRTGYPKVATGPGVCGPPGAVASAAIVANSTYGWFRGFLTITTGGPYTFTVTEDGYQVGDVALQCYCMTCCCGGACATRWLRYR